MDLSQIQHKIDALGGTGTVAGIYVGAAAMALVLAGVVMWMGASVAGIQGATLLRSIFAAVVSGILSTIALAGGSAIPAVGAGGGLVLSAIGSAVGIKVVYRTTFVKAVLVGFCVLLVLLALSLILYSVLRTWGKINGTGP
jgi:uncharacterized iron-regulated membrane protein